MGTFSDTIRLTVDVVAGQTQGFKGFLTGLKTDVNEADGAFGKLKAGASGAFDFVKNNAAAFAVAGGAAIAGFVGKAVGDFNELALEAAHLSDALGVSAEDASRWIEVAGDLGISTGTLETAMGKMLKTAGSTPDVFEKLGVQIAKAKDGSVDANGTFLNVIDRLNGMKDPAERAAAAQQLLGKSWRDAAELIGLGADGVKKRLADVSDAKIISDDQIGQARDMRDSMDDLADAGENLSIALASTVLPVLARLAELAAKVAGPISDLVISAQDVKAEGDKQGASFAEQFWGGLVRSVPLVSGDGFWDLFLGEGAEDIDASISPEFLAKLDAANEKAAKFGPILKLTAQEGVAAYSDMADGLHELAVNTEAYEQTVSSADFGKAELEGALAANQAYSEQLFALPDIAAEGEAAIDAFGDSIKDADGNVQAASLTFDLNTEAGRKQQDALKGIASTLDTQFAAAFDAAGGDMSNFMGRADTISNSTLKRLQSEFGLSDQQVDGLRDSLGLTAKDWSARFELSGTEVAREKIGLLQTSIADLPKDVRARVAADVVKGDYTSALSEIQGYYNRNPVVSRVTTVAGGRLSAIGGTIPEEGTWAGEYGMEFIKNVGGTDVVKTRAESANIARGAGGDTYNLNITAADARGAVFEFERWKWFRDAQPSRAR